MIHCNFPIDESTSRKRPSTVWMVSTRWKRVTGVKGTRTWRSTTSKRTWSSLGIRTGVTYLQDWERVCPRTGTCPKRWGWWGTGLNTGNRTSKWFIVIPLVPFLISRERKKMWNIPINSELFLYYLIFFNGGDDNSFWTINFEIL